MPDTGWTSRYRMLRKYLPRVHEDLSATYSRHLHKWLLIAPVIGLITGLATTAIALIILHELWPPVLNYYLRHHWAIVPGVVFGFIIAGLIMQYPHARSRRALHRRNHSLLSRASGPHRDAAFVPKLLAAIATVGFGGSAALEGPSIYGGGAIGSWLWTKLAALSPDRRDRRIMLISGAAAGNGCGLSCPAHRLGLRTGNALQRRPCARSFVAVADRFRRLLRHPGVLFWAPGRLFDFPRAMRPLQGRDLIWSAILGVLIGLVAMIFAITFRRARQFVVKWKTPHWVK